jgi:hypothetical protein
MLGQRESVASDTPRLRPLRTIQAEWLPNDDQTHVVFVHEGRDGSQAFFPRT